MTCAVSIILPVYNGARYVACALRSVLAQTFSDFEVVVVNDGSTDQSREAIRPFLTDRRVKYIEQANAGVAAARNTALTAASGRLVAFIDQDDLWLPDKLKLQVSVMDSRPGVGLIHTAYELIDAEGRPMGEPSFHRWRPDVEGRCLRDLFIRNRVALPTAMARRSSLDKAGPFDSRIDGADEYAIWLQISAHAEVAYLPTVLARYRVHDSNASHNVLKMATAELGAVESLLRNQPQLRAEIGDSVIAERLGELCADVASYLAWLARDDISARRYWMRAMRHRPLHGRAFLGFAKTLIPPRWSSATKWYMRRMQAAMRRRGPTSQQ